MLHTTSYRLKINVGGRQKISVAVISWVSRLRKCGAFEGFLLRKRNHKRSHPNPANKSFEYSRYTF